MFNIYTNEDEKNGGRRDLSYEELNKNLETICLSHVGKDEAFAFAFLLYRNRNCDMIKALRDSDYWNSLDDIVMNFLSVFSLNCTNIGKAHINVPRRRNDNHPWGDAEDSSSKEVNILDYLNLKKDIDLPAFCFFTIDKEGDITDCFVREIRAKEFGAIKNEMEKVLTKVVESLSRITPDNKFNAEQILRIVKDAAKDNPIGTGARFELILNLLEVIVKCIA